MKGRQPNHHYRVAHLPDGSVKVLAKAGQRRLSRRKAIVRAVLAAFRGGAGKREAFQNAVRTQGARPADRRWLFANLKKIGVI